MSDELRQFYREAVEDDGGRESGQMRMTRETLEELDRLRLTNGKLVEALASLDETSTIADELESEARLMRQVGYPERSNTFQNFCDRLRTIVRKYRG